MNTFESNTPMVTAALDTFIRKSEIDSMQGKPGYASALIGLQELTHSDYTGDLLSFPESPERRKIFRACLDIEYIESKTELQVIVWGIFRKGEFPIMFRVVVHEPAPELESLITGVIISDTHLTFAQLYQDEVDRLLQMGYEPVRITRRVNQ